MLTPWEIDEWTGCSVKHLEGRQEPQVAASRTRLMLGPEIDEVQRTIVAILESLRVPRSGLLVSARDLWDNPTMILRLDSRRRVGIPASLSPASPGDDFEARFDQVIAWIERERAALQAWLSDVLTAMEGRVISFNVSIAHAWAEIRADLRRQGLTMPIEDSYIAATARRLGGTR